MPRNAMTRHGRSRYATTWRIGVLVLLLAGLGPGPGLAGSAEVWVEPWTGMEFVRVPGGCYHMGCGFWSTDCEADEQPVREVCVEDFWMGRYEVTQAQWETVMAGNPSRVRGPDNPVESVSWNDAQEFIARLNSRDPSAGFGLPREVEWEYACRGGGRLETYCGGRDADHLAWHAGNSGGRPHPVGRKAPNGFGLHDMSGNVAEWCADAWDRDARPYSSSPSSPASPDSLARIGRGGSFGYLPRHVRSSFRDWFALDSVHPDLGLRLVRRDPSAPHQTVR